MLAMYLLGIVVALLMAWLFKKTLLKGETPMLIMELPPYKRPLLRVVLRHMWDRSRLFLRRAGHGDSGHQHPAVVSGDVSDAAPREARRLSNREPGQWRSNFPKQPRPPRRRKKSRDCKSSLKNLPVWKANCRRWIR